MADILRGMRLGRVMVGMIVAGCGATPKPVAPGHAADPALALPTAPRQIALTRAPAAGGAAPGPLLGLMKQELDRSVTGLGKRGDPPPYFLSYTAYDIRDVTITASMGALEDSSDLRQRVVDVDARLGDFHLDNTHSRESAGEFAAPTPLPLDDDPLALHSALWLATDAAYKRAQTALIHVRAERKVDVAERDTSDDFSHEPPAHFVEAPARLQIDAAAWQAKVKSWSAMFASHPHIESGSVSLLGAASTRTFVSSEGSGLQTARTHARIEVSAEITADDGSVIDRSAEIDAHEPGGLPSDAEVRARVEGVIRDLEALRAAKPGSPYVGPVILDGRAAAVFFHEIFGHRVEGHRQKSEAEGQTFADKVGEALMPALFDVYDDPTIRAVDGIDLNGFYRYDDEGVPAARASLIDHGVFRGFILSRSPVRGFSRSNGHGRRAPGYRALSRQANLIVDPARVTTPAALKQALIDEVKRQHKPYGLRVGEVIGGYTMTQREDTQAFKVEPVMVYRVYPDGREELIRGVTLEGTPLVAIADVIAAADDFAVFNGYCGAESGDVPASAVSPSLLLRKLEVTRQDKGADRPPLLSAPPMQEKQP